MNPEVLLALRRTARPCATYATALMLAILGRAGTAGRGTDELMAASGFPRTTVLKACRALARAGLVAKPGKQARGKTMRHTITGAGFSLLTLPDLTVETMHPLPIAP